MNGASRLPFTPQDDDVLLTRPEAAQYLRVHVSTLEKWAMRGEGPPYILVGKGARYPLGWLRRFTQGAKAAA